MLYATDALLNARHTMDNINPQLTGQFTRLFEYLIFKPSAGAQRKNLSFPIESSIYIDWSAKKFAAGRIDKQPNTPQTVPDNMVSVILHQYYNCEEEQLPRIQHEHRLSMAAENIIGDLLERYLASVLEPRGWIWCSGETLTSIDFIRPPSDISPKWFALQVKNRDNSENSSSNKVRKDKDIHHWFRTFSKKNGDNWAAFPGHHSPYLLSEEDFERFVRGYLADIKSTAIPSLFDMIKLPNKGATVF
ncbi:SinI family restriction endonuclease [Pseudomonas rustica]|jgi:hypothetical protein|uniref:SinI family restriction endonuclease n=1 Tax=Pseudomonas rustica TaxID=2827099 RepID=UPI003CF19114